MKSCFILLAALMLLGSEQTFAGKEGGGGDALVAEFTEIASAMLQGMAADADSTKMANIDLATFVEDVRETQIESTDQILVSPVDHLQKDALNYPKEKLIIFNRTRWTAIDDLDKKAHLVTHEFLGIYGLDDSQYQVSDPLVDEVLSILKAMGQVTIYSQINALTPTSVLQIYPHAKGDAGCDFAVDDVKVRIGQILQKHPEMKPTDLRVEKVMDQSICAPIIYVTNPEYVLASIPDPIFPVGTGDLDQCQQLLRGYEATSDVIYADIHQPFVNPPGYCQLTLVQLLKKQGN